MGILLTRFGVRPVMSIGIMLAALGCFIFALAPDASMAYVGRSMIGMGTSVTVMGGLAIVALWFPIRRFAFLAGMVMAIAGLGSLAATSPWALITSAIGWRGGTIIVAVVFTIMAIACFCVIRNPPRAKDAPVNQHPYKDALQKIMLAPRFWIMGITSGCRYGVIGTLQAAWAGPFLMHGFGMSQLSASHILSLFAIGYIVGMPLLGWISDKLMTRKYVICVGQGLLGVLIFTFFFWTPAPPYGWWPFLLPSYPYLPRRATRCLPMPASLRRPTWQPWPLPGLTCSPCWAARYLSR